MLAKLRRFVDDYLEPASTGGDPEHRLHLACAVLLVEAARADFDVDPAEIARITSQLEQRFGLSSTEARDLTRLARDRAEAASGLHEFTSYLNANMDLDERVELVESMWRVVYEDAVLDDHEHHLMSKVRSLLYVPQKQFIAAKLRARGG